LAINKSKGFVEAAARTIGFLFLSIVKGCSMNKKSNYLFASLALIMGISVSVLLVFIISLFPMSVKAAPEQIFNSDETSPPTSTNSAIYLPLINLNYFNDPSLPSLKSPQNGEELDTRIPTLIWDTGTQPTSTMGCLAFDTQPNPMVCKFTYENNSNRQKENFLSYNLKPDMKYYWRVGAVYNHDFDHPEWSEEWSFSTGPAGCGISSSPVLQSPANNSLVSSPTITLTWQPIDEAIEYNLHIQGLDTDLSELYTGITTTQKVINLGDLIQNGYGNNFEWDVIARNGFAWSNRSEKWKFTYSTK
jgi:hypothetical protein